MTERICMNCKWYGNRKCCKYPPKVFLEPDTKLARTIWPEVYKVDFCSEFEEKE